MSLIEVSDSNSWADAKKEWKFQRIEVKNTSCVCGTHINKNVVVFNSSNGKEVVIGQNCAYNFMNMHFRHIFRELTKLKKYLKKRTDSDAIQFYLGQGIIDLTEFNFLTKFKNTMYKHLSDIDLAERVRIHKKILKHYDIIPDYLQRA